MKVISVLLVSQILLTLVVIVKLVDIDNRVDRYEAATGPASAATTDFLHSQSNLVATPPSGLSRDDLREIVREELVAHVAGAALPTGNNGRNPSPEAIDTPEYRERLENVSQRLDYFESVGEISGAEMEQFHAEIAKLQASDRQHMLNRLTQSMNAGRIKGLL